MRQAADGKWGRDVSTEVAITAIIEGKAVKLAAIVTAGWLIRAAIPQFRMSKPDTPQDGGKQ